jgi:hypothetical protein
MDRSAWASQSYGHYDEDKMGTGSSSDSSSSESYDDEDLMDIDQGPDTRRSDNAVNEMFRLMRGGRERLQGMPSQPVKDTQPEHIRRSDNAIDEMFRLMRGGRERLQGVPSRPVKNIQPEQASLPEQEVHDQQDLQAVQQSTIKLDVTPGEYLHQAPGIANYSSDYTAWSTAHSLEFENFVHQVWGTDNAFPNSQSVSAQNTSAVLPKAETSKKDSSLKVPEKVVKPIGSAANMPHITKEEDCRRNRVARATGKPPSKLTLQIKATTDPEEKAWLIAKQDKIRAQSAQNSRKIRARIRAEKQAEADEKDGIDEAELQKTNKKK